MARGNVREAHTASNEAMLLSHEILNVKAFVLVIEEAAPEPPPIASLWPIESSARESHCPCQRGDSEAVIASRVGSDLACESQALSLVGGVFPGVDGKSVVAKSNFSVYSRNGLGRVW